MLIRKIGRNNNSLYITLPKDLCELYGIEKGDNLAFGIEYGKITIHSFDEKRLQARILPDEAVLEEGTVIERYGE
jgi:antitoxin component of MazEF toxin-antitoxin module